MESFHIAVTNPINKINFNGIDYFSQQESVSSDDTEIVMDENITPDRQVEILEKALEAIIDRGCFAAYPEVPSGKIYGETAKADGQAAFEGYLGSDFSPNQYGTEGTVGGEISPYGLAD